MTQTLKLRPMSETPEIWPVWLYLADRIDELEKKVK